MPATKRKSAEPPRPEAAILPPQVQAPAPEAKQLPPLEEALRNPYLYFSFEEIADIFGFGRDVLTLIGKHPKAPIVAKKMNPKILHEWLRRHGHELGKVRTEKTDDSNPVKQN